MAKTKNNIFIYVFIVFASVSLTAIIFALLWIFLLSRNENNEPAPMQISSDCPVEYVEEDIYKIQDEFIKLPENNFDIEKTILNTDITIKYPSKGFYNLGAKVVTEPAIAEQNFLGAVAILTENDDFNLTLSVGAYSIKENATLEEQIDEFKKNVKNYEAAYIAVGRGNTITVNNNPFFIYKVIQNNISWHAIAIMGGKKITVSLTGSDALGMGGGLEERAIQEDIDELFIKILKNINIE